MKFIIDEQLSPVVARWIARRGHDAEHVVETGLLSMSDAAISRRAFEAGAVVVTKDEDYLDWRVWVGSLQVLWLRVGNVSNRILLARLDEMWPEVIERLERGEEIVTVFPEPPAP